VLLLVNNAFLGKALSCEYSDNNYDLSVFRRWILAPQEAHFNRPRKAKSFLYAGVLPRRDPPLPIPN